MKKLLSLFAVLCLTVSAYAGYFAYNIGDIINNGWSIGSGIPAIVNHVSGTRNVYVQDHTGGIMLYSNSDVTCNVGDSIIFNGSVTTYAGAPEIYNATIQVISSGNNLPAEKQITLVDFLKNPLSYFAQRVCIKNVYINGFDQNGYIYVSDGSWHNGVFTNVLCYGVAPNQTDFPQGTHINLHLIGNYYNAPQFIGDTGGIEVFNAGPARNYTITLYAPDCGGYTPAIIGDFNNWSQAVAMTPGLDASGNTIYTATIQASEGTYFKFRQAGISDWSNEILMPDESGTLYPTPNLQFDEKDSVVIDFSLGSYTLCPPRHTVSFYDSNGNLIKSYAVDEGNYTYYTTYYDYEFTWKDCETNEIYTENDLLNLRIYSDRCFRMDSYAYANIDGFYYNFNRQDSTATLISGAGTYSSKYTDYTTAIIPETVVRYRIPFRVTSIGNRAFYNCSSLTSVTIPNSIQYIGQSAFNRCSGLTSVTIPNSVTSIGNYAFEGCSGLTEIVIPATLDSIGSFAFMYCNNLQKVIVHNPDITIINDYNGVPSSPISYCYALDTLVAPASWLVYSMNNLKYVKLISEALTEGVQEVLSFSAKTLRKIDASATTNTSLPDQIFYHLYNLDTLILPAGLEEINYMAVAECMNLKGIDIPASVTSIDARAFENCRSLQTVNFNGNALQSIGNWAFYNAHALQNIVIPEGVTSIGDGAFYGCNYLNNLSLPASVCQIGDYGFAQCERLQKMQVDATVPPMVAAETFATVNRSIPVYVPDAVVADYQSAPVWCEFNIVGQSNMGTGINPVKSANVQPRKVLEDGKMYIIMPDGTKYSTTGKKVK